ncbi:hypothetical protein M0804_008015 [Polistes exclamans]|nr:hypothetical protein M0804_008015 [Polistes exclamans]
MGVAGRQEDNSSGDIPVAPRRGSSCDSTQQRGYALFPVVGILNAASGTDVQEEDDDDDEEEEEDAFFLHFIRHRESIVFL